MVGCRLQGTLTEDPYRIFHRLVARWQLSASKHYYDYVWAHFYLQHKYSLSHILGSHTKPRRLRVVLQCLLTGGVCGSPMSTTYWKERSNWTKMSTGTPTSITRGVDTPMNIIKGGGGGGKCAQILQARGHCVTLTAIIRWPLALQW